MSLVAFLQPATCYRHSDGAAGAMTFLDRVREPGGARNSGRVVEKLGINLDRLEQERMRELDLALLIVGYPRVDVTTCQQDSSMTSAPDCPLLSPSCRRHRPAQVFRPDAELVGELAAGKWKDCRSRNKRLRSQ